MNGLRVGLFVGEWNVYAAVARMGAVKLARVIAVPAAHLNRRSIVTPERDAASATPVRPVSVWPARHPSKTAPRPIGFS